MPYMLGAASRAHLAGVHPRLVAVVERAITITTQDFCVQEGVRSIQTQREYVERGVSKTMHSMHLRQPDGYGHAVDLVPWIDGAARWEWGAIYPIAEAMRQAARDEGVELVWGGAWDRKLTELRARPMREAAAYCRRHPGPDFLDGPHYQLA